LSKLDERSGKPDERHSDAGSIIAAGGVRVVCASAELAERGNGVRFEIEWEGETVPAFVIRHEGRAYGYLNRCSHIGVELDWMHGKFFDAGGEYLICSTHGALYAPESGACRGGPCRGEKLAALDVFEDGGKVYIKTKG
jgi:nitrite reductase/ring-hydroxylating ferredoxin subunit